MSRRGCIRPIFSARWDNERGHDLEGGVEHRGLPSDVGTAADGGSRVRHLQHYDWRQYDVHWAPFEEQGAVFLVFLDEPAALADFLGAKSQFFKRFDIEENEILSVMITELDTTILHVSERHALTFRECVVGEAIGPEVAQARVQLRFGLRRAADVELLDRLWDASEHQDHPTFEL